MRAAVALIPDRAISHRAPSLGRSPGTRHGRPDGEPVDDGRDPHPLGHRAGRPAGRRAAPAAGLRRAAQAGRPEAGPGEARPDAPGHRPGPRGVPAAGRTASRPSTGTAAATSSPPPPRPCAASSSTSARRKRSPKHGGGRRRRRPRRRRASPSPRPADDLLALDEALDRLAAEDPRKAELVKLRFFAGLTAEQAAAALGVSASTAEPDWAYARRLAPGGDRPHVRPPALTDSGKNR